MFELVHTSVRQGLAVGASGYCSVAWTRGFPRNLISPVERLSAYQNLYPAGHADAALNPVSCFHMTMNYAGAQIRVVGNICFCGLDYTGRSNKLAHHLVFTKSDEFGGRDPLAVALARDNFFTRWDRSPLELDPRLPLRSSLPGLPAAQWEAATGDPGWAGMIAGSFRRSPGRSLTLEFAPGTPVETLLGLIAEAAMLLTPEECERFTFNTYSFQNQAGQNIFLRAMPTGSVLLGGIRRLFPATVISLVEPGPVPKEFADSELVAAARGKRGVTVVSMSPPPPRQTPAGMVPEEGAEAAASTRGAVAARENGAEEVEPPVVFRVSERQREIDEKNSREPELKLFGFRERRRPEPSETAELNPELPVSRPHRRRSLLFLRAVGFLVVGLALIAAAAMLLRDRFGAGSGETPRNGVVGTPAEEILPVPDSSSGTAPEAPVPEEVASSERPASEKVTPPEVPAAGKDESKQVPPEGSGAEVAKSWELSTADKLVLWRQWPRGGEVAASGVEIKLPAALSRAVSLKVKLDGVGSLRQFDGVAPESLVESVSGRVLVRALRVERQGLGERHIVDDNPETGLHLELLSGMVVITPPKRSEDGAVEYPVPDNIAAVIFVDANGVELELNLRSLPEPTAAELEAVRATPGGVKAVAAAPGYRLRFTPSAEVLRLYPAVGISLGGREVQLGENAPDVELAGAIDLSVLERYERARQEVAEAQKKYDAAVKQAEEKRAEVAALDWDDFEISYREVKEGDGVVDRKSESPEKASQDAFRDERVRLISEIENGLGDRKIATVVLEAMKKNLHDDAAIDEKTRLRLLKRLDRARELIAGQFAEVDGVERCNRNWKLAGERLDAVARDVLVMLAEFGEPVSRGFAVKINGRESLGTPEEVVAGVIDKLGPPQVLVKGRGNTDEPDK